MSTDVCLKTKVNETTSEQTTSSVCVCSQCTHTSSQLVSINRHNAKNKRIVKRIVNRMISKTKLNSIDLINDIHTKLSETTSEKSSTSTATTASTKQVSIKSFSRTSYIYEPFGKVHKRKKLNKFVSLKRYSRKPKYNYINFDFSQESNINSDNSANSIQLLPWETSLKFKRKNRYFDSSNKRETRMKSKENKHWSSLLRAKNQNLITKSDLSNKIKLSNNNSKLNCSGSELKNYLLSENNNSSNVKLETSITNTIKKNTEEINTSVNNNKNNNNNLEINIDKSNLNELQQQQQQKQQQPKSLTYTDIIKRVLKMKKSF